MPYGVGFTPNKFYQDPKDRREHFQNLVRGTVTGNISLVTELLKIDNCSVNIPDYNGITLLGYTEFIWGKDDVKSEMSGLILSNNAHHHRPRVDPIPKYEWKKMFEY